jgi:hypothetical protein
MSKMSNCFAQRLLPFDADQAITPKFIPYGANMATRRLCFEECSYDATIGPLEKTEVRGEEAALIDDFFSRGLQGVWVKGAKVRHFIPAGRLTKQFIWKYFHGSGQLMVRRKHLAFGNEAQFFGYPRWLVRKYFQNYALSCLLAPLKNSRWIDCFTKAAICRGMMNEFKATNFKAGTVVAQLETP